MAAVLKVKSIIAVSSLSGSGSLSITSTILCTNTCNYVRFGMMARRILEILSLKLSYEKEEIFSTRPSKVEGVIKFSQKADMSF